MRTRLMFPVFMAVGLVVLILASTSNAHAIGFLNVGHGCDGKTKCDAKPKAKCGAEPKCAAEPKCGAKAGHKRHLQRRNCDAKPKPKCGAEPKCGAKKKCGCSAA